MKIKVLISFITLFICYAFAETGMWDKTKLDYFPVVKKLGDALARWYESKCASNGNQLTIAADLLNYDGCGKLYICNSTSCLVFNFGAVIWSNQIPLQHDDDVDDSEHRFQKFMFIDPSIVRKADSTVLTDNEVAKKYPLTKYDISVNKNRLPGLEWNWNLFMMNQDFRRTTTRMAAELSQYCLGRKLYNVVLEGYGELPNGCTDVKICQEYSCTVFSKPSFTFAEYRHRDFSKFTNNTDVCRTEQQDRFIEPFSNRKKRGVVRDKLENSQQPQSLGLLRFNLPGYRYCGPFTDIDVMDNEGGPINDLDDACRSHDVDYLSGSPPLEADRRFLAKVQSLTPTYYPLFLMVFTAKEAWERRTETYYTSYLYFYPSEFKPSLTLFFAHHSVYANGTDSESMLTNGNTAENRWQTILKDIWIGSCTKRLEETEELLPISQAAGGDKTPHSKLPSSSDIEEGRSNQPGPSRQIQDNPPMEQDVGKSKKQKLDTDAKFAEHNPFRCFNLINEVLPTKRFVSQYSKQHFIEFTRKCGERTKINVVEKMDGHMLIIIDIGQYKINDVDVPAIVFSADLSNASWTRRLNDMATPEWYSVIGHGVENVNVRLDQPHVQHIQSKTPDFVNAIPSEKDYPTVVLLLFFKIKDRPLMKQLKLRTVRSQFNEFGAMQVTTEIENVIRPRVIDSFVFGRGCSTVQHGHLKLLHEHFPEDCNDAMSRTEQVIPFYEQEITTSYSRCAKGNAPFQSYSFKDAEISPGEPNFCKSDMVLDYPFKFKALRPQSHAQMLALNLWYSIKQSKIDERILEGEPQVVAARLIGVGPRILISANKRWRNNAIMTPAKVKPEYQCPVQTKIDTFDRDWIRREIVFSYKNGAAPTGPILYEKFMIYKKQQNDDLSRLFNSDPMKYTAPEPFQCSQQTFRKVLHVMGFKYAVIDTRAGIIQRPDIIRWRGKYLRVLRENEKLLKPKKIVYIDETWIDTNMKVARGWIPRDCHRIKNMAPYTYGNLKVGRGPRLIVLSAVAESGIIPESVLVYKVHKSQTAEDYHENVNAETFKRWYMTLLEYLDATGDKYIIVMDNASYHSTKLVPKKSQRKQILYDWLQKYSTFAGVDFVLPQNIKDIRKFELEELVDRVSQLPSMRNEIFMIDKLTAERGHQVLRLPPYNCDLNPIELCWKDVKHNTRKLNTEQNLDIIKSIVENELKNYNKEILSKHWAHVKRLEQEYWEDDGHLEELTTASVVIPIEDINDDEDDEDEDVEYTRLDSVDEVEIGGDILLNNDCNLEDEDFFGEEIDLGSYMASGPPRKKARNRFCLPNLPF